MSEPTDPVLLIDGPTFYSRNDEDHFFGWLKSIPAIKKVTGEGRGLELMIERPIDKESLRDLIALMMRYRVDCRPLRTLCDEQKDEYFRDKRRDWHSAIYG